MLTAGPNMPAMTANKFEKYCESLSDVLWDDTKCLTAVQQACGILDKVLGGNYARDKAKDSTIQTRRSS